MQDFVSLLTTVVLTCIYVIFTGNPVYYMSNEAQWYRYFLLATHLYFSVDFLIRLIAAEKVLRFLLTLSAFIDIVTSFPMVFLYFFFDMNSITFRAAMMLDPWRFYLNKRLF